LPLPLLYFKTDERADIKSLLRRDKQKKAKNASFKSVNDVTCYGWYSCIVWLRLVSPDEKDVQQH
jgi:hypothetical protein